MSGRDYDGDLYDDLRDDDEDAIYVDDDEYEDDELDEADERGGAGRSSTNPFTTSKPGTGSLPGARPSVYGGSGSGSSGAGGSSLASRLPGSVGPNRPTSPASPASGASPSGVRPFGGSPSGSGSGSSGYGSSSAPRPGSSSSSGSGSSGGFGSSSAPRPGSPSSPGSGSSGGFGSSGAPRPGSPSSPGAGSSGGFGSSGAPRPGSPSSPGAGSSGGFGSSPLGRKDEPKKDEPKKDEPKKDDKGGIGGKLGGFLNRGGDKDKDSKPAPSAKPAPDKPADGGKSSPLGGLFNRGSDKKDEKAPAKAEAKGGGFMDRLRGGGKGDDQASSGAPAYGSRPGSAPPTSGARPAGAGGSSPSASGSQTFGKPMGSIGGMSAGAATKTADKAPGAKKGLFGFLGRGRAEEKKPAAKTARPSKAPRIEEDQWLTLDKKLDIVGVALVLGALMIFFSTLSTTRGAVTEAITNFLSGIFGWGWPAIPLAMLAVGVWLVARHFGEEAPVIERSRVIGVIVLYIGLLVFLQFLEAFNYTEANGRPVRNLVELELQLRASWEAFRAGGGWIGAQLYFLLVSNVGEIGSFFALIFWVIIGLMLALSLSFSELALVVIGAGRSFADARRRRAVARAAEREKALAVKAAQQAAVSVSKPAVEALPAVSAPALPAAAQPALPVPEPRSIPITIGGRTVTADMTAAEALAAGPQHVPLSPAPQPVAAAPAPPVDDKPSGGLGRLKMPFGLPGRGEQPRIPPAQPLPTARPAEPAAPASLAAAPPAPAASPVSPSASPPAPAEKSGGLRGLFGRAGTPPAAPVEAEKAKAEAAPTPAAPAPGPLRSPMPETGRSAPPPAPAASAAPTAPEARWQRPEAAGSSGSAPPAFKSPSASPAGRSLADLRPFADDADEDEDDLDLDALDELDEADAPGEAEDKPARLGDLLRPASKPAEPASRLGDLVTKSAAPTPPSAPAVRPYTPAAPPRPASTTPTAPTAPATPAQPAAKPEDTLSGLKPTASPPAAKAAPPLPPRDAGKPAAPFDLDDEDESDLDDEDIASEELRNLPPAQPKGTGPLPRPEENKSRFGVVTFGKAISGTAETHAAKNDQPAADDDKGKDDKPAGGDRQDRLNAIRSGSLTPPAASTPARPTPTPAAPPTSGSAASGVRPFSPASISPAARPAASPPPVTPAANQPPAARPAAASTPSAAAPPAASQPPAAPPTPERAAPVISPPGAAATPQPPTPAPLTAQPPAGRRREWRLPEEATLLRPGSDQDFDRDSLLARARIIEETLTSFGAPGKVVEVNTGPVITQFAVEPDYLVTRGGKKNRVKVGAIAQLDKDLQLALGAKSIRIEAPVPGKGYVGIEVPNDKPALVSLRDVMESDEFNRIKSPLTIALGQSVDGTPVAADLSVMPHLLIAGTTGSGKSVCVNAIIASLLLRNPPDRVKFIMVDPKRVELTGYNGIPHLVAPVVVELERIVGVLKWVTREMDERYKRFSSAGARNIEDYNKHLPDGDEIMPYIIVIIDELADLMMLAPDETERVITRIAALARATGIHLVIATQRPSVDVVTGLIKANFPARIAFAVASSVDSRVIIDQPGADRLLGRGDMLYMSGDSPAPVRLQGVFVSDTEINNINRYWKSQVAAGEVSAKPITQLVLDHTIAEPSRPVAPDNTRQQVQQAFWDRDTGKPAVTPGAGSGGFSFGAAEADDGPQDAHEDELYEEAVELVRRLNKASVSLLQRRLRIGYTRAARLIDLMEEEGIVGPAESGSKPREVLPRSS